jgi:hypothetical protein
MRSVRGGTVEGLNLKATCDALIASMKLVFSRLTSPYKNC